VDHRIKANHIHCCLYRTWGQVPRATHRPKGQSDWSPI